MKYMIYELMINYRIKIHIDPIININPFNFPKREKVALNEQLRTSI